MTSIDFVGQEVRVFGDTVVTVTTAVIAIDGTKPQKDTLVYTRVWQKTATGGWQLAAGQATLVQ